MASLNTAATLPTPQNRSAQSALIAARVLGGGEVGLSLAVCRDGSSGGRRDQPLAEESGWRRPAAALLSAELDLDAGGFE